MGAADSGDETSVMKRTATTAPVETTEAVAPEAALQAAPAPTEAEQIDQLVQTGNTDEPAIRPRPIIHSQFGPLFVAFHLSTGAIRPALVVDATNPEALDLRVFCAGPEDAEHFGGSHGIEFVRGAKRGTGPGCWQE
jgi:hypothetical protein